ncbi:unnamed protein product [Rhizopus microsporus]
MNRVNTKASSQGEKKQGVSVKKRKRKKRGKKKSQGGFLLAHVFQKRIFAYVHMIVNKDSLKSNQPSSLVDVIYITYTIHS